MEVARSRPVGVSIIAILLGIQGALQIIYSLLLFVRAPQYVISSGNAVAVVQVSPWGFLISGILVLILTYGLWTLRSWAFWVTVFVEILNLIGGFVALFSYYYPWAVLLSMVIPAVILIYFLADSNVRTAFNV